MASIFFLLVICCAIVYQISENIVRISEAISSKAASIVSLIACGAGLDFGLSFGFLLLLLALVPFDCDIGVFSLFVVVIVIGVVVVIAATVATIAREMVYFCLLFVLLLFLLFLLFVLVSVLLVGVLSFLPDAPPGGLPGGGSTMVGSCFMTYKYWCGAAN